MKKSVSLAIASIALLTASAQDFPGSRTGNYTGVNGVFYNPANIADSRYRFDVNLFSLSAMVGNNQASFKLSNLSESFKGDSLKNQLFGKNAGPASGIINLDIHGPSAMFNIGKRNTIALTTRARTFTNVVDFDGKLFDQLTKDFSNGSDLPYTISSKQNMRLSVNAWTEFGVSIGRVISNMGPHYLKGGLTLKYLSGAGNGYFNIDNLNTTIDADLLLQDVYLTNTTGRIAMGFGGMRISDFQADQFTKMKSSGFGAEIGFVYEFRPGAADNQRSDQYKFRFGAALVDLGSIRYEKDMNRSGAYDINIPDGDKLYVSEFNNMDIDDYNTFFKGRQGFTSAPSNNETSYSVSLPTTLQLDGDYYIQKGFYVSLASQLSLSSNKVKGYNNLTYSSVTLTPRFEGKRFGVFVPLNYNQLTKMNAGISLRAGPVFLGSGSLLSALIGQSRQADVHLGVRFGRLR